MTYIFVLIAGLISGTISGVIGTGSSIILLPILVVQFGAKQAVPIMAVSSVMANIAKAVAWRRDIDWKAFAAYSATGIPAAVLGARTLLQLPEHIVDVALGIFFLAMVPIRHWLQLRRYKIRLWQLAIAGAIIGFLTGIALATGPLSVPAFVSYGLIKGPFLSTEAASSLGLMIAKVITFRELGALPISAILQGVVIGSSVMIGAFAAKAIVERMSHRTHQNLLDALLFGSGLSLLWAAVR